MMESYQIIENAPCPSCGAHAIQRSFHDGITSEICVHCSPNDCYSVAEIARKLHITERQVRNLCECGELLARKASSGEWVILDMRQPSPPVHTLKELIDSRTTIRYDYNAHLACYTGLFDFMKIACDGQYLIYSIHGKHLALNGVPFALPLTQIKPFYRTLVYHAEVSIEPLHMEIDDELIVFLNLILDLYEKGKIFATAMTDQNTMLISPID